MQSVMMADASSGGAYLVFACGRDAGQLVRSLLAVLPEGASAIFVAGDRPAEVAGHALAREHAKRLTVARHPLGRLTRAVPRDVVLAGAVIDTTGASLPGNAWSWLKTVGAEELGEALVANADGGAGDPVLWARLAEAISAEVRHRQRLEERQSQCEDGRPGGGSSSEQQRRPPRAAAAVADVVRAAMDKLGDSGGIPPRVVLDGMRGHLRHEDRGLELGLSNVVERLILGGRCAVLTGRHQATAVVRRVLHSMEDCKPEMVANWQREKLFTLYPLLRRDPRSERAVADVTTSSSVGLLPGVVVRGVQVHVLESRVSAKHDWGARPSVTPELSDLFVEPRDQPEFSGAT